MHEFEIIKKYFSKLSLNNKNSLKLNDDVFFDKSKKLVISVDTYIDKSHFFDFKYPDLVIKKILRSSISDLICKGVKPKYYFISGSGNKETFIKSNLKKISQSLNQEQKKFGIYISGGDTVFSNKLSFTIITVGFSSNIIFRNKAKFNDDIYVTGNLGDSYMGLEILKKKFSFKKDLNKYFLNKYYLPELHINLTKKLFNFANTSIDISDGLFADLDKLINKQKLSYKVKISNIPISKNLKKIILLKKLKKMNFVSKGDDYQILFTASKKKSRVIKRTFKSLGIKISKIGNISSGTQKSQIIDEKGNKIAIKNKGYFHNF
ncbi:thiamine-phosphate kinase [Candidatus Pelagibacter sp.]|uniref:thiamine-phosphate kinase n=1 Tax=Candidatus Pelagibacter sp. TaxID=2024849 RepID=UPI003F866C8C